VRSRSVYIFKTKAWWNSSIRNCRWLLELGISIRLTSICCWVSLCPLVQIVCGLTGQILAVYYQMPILENLLYYYVSNILMSLCHLLTLLLGIKTLHFLLVLYCFKIPNWWAASSWIYLCFPIYSTACCICWNFMVAHDIFCCTSISCELLHLFPFQMNSSFKNLNMQGSGTKRRWKTNLMLDRNLRFLHFAAATAYSYMLFFLECLFCCWLMCHGGL